MTDFHVGQKVVCVDDSGWSQSIHAGSIYTIISMNFQFGHWLRLAESPTCDGGGFAARRFRPLEEQSQAIKLFRRIAADATKHRHVTVREDA